MNTNTVILYSTGCPRCSVLKRKLSENNIMYIESDDVEQMYSLGIQSVPVLFVDGELLDFSKAIAWVNSQGGDGNAN